MIYKVDYGVWGLHGSPAAYGIYYIELDGAGFKESITLNDYNTGDYLVAVNIDSGLNVGFNQEIYSIEDIPDGVPYTREDVTKTIKLSTPGVHQKAYLLVYDDEVPSNRVNNLNQIDLTDDIKDIVFANTGDGDGNDKVNTGKGDDLVFGRKGNDKIWGGEGKDALIGGKGKDSLYGDNGDDYLDGGIGADILNGGNGADILYGGEGNDDLQGLQGDDSILGEAGNDRLRGGNGNDTLDGGIGNDRFAGYTGNDSLIGGEGKDLLEGGSGNDTLIGDTGKDRLRGGEGNDSLNGGNGADILDGGNGADNFVFKSSYHDGIDRIIDFKWTEGDKIQVGFGGGYSQFTYNSLTGGLFFNDSLIDGIPAIQFATLSPNTDFEASRDIVFI